MIFVVKRRWPDSKSVMGQLLINTFHECYTLEPAKPIVAGTYDLTIRWSNHFQRLMPHVENVPGHAGIEIHWGNTSKDTELCTLVGSIMGLDFVGHSVDEFNALFKKIQDALATGPQKITYLDPEPFVMHPDIDGEISV